MCALDFVLTPPKEIALGSDDAQPLLDVVFGEYRPNQVVAQKRADAESAIPLLENRVTLNGKTTIRTTLPFRHIRCGPPRATEISERAITPYLLHSTTRCSRERRPEPATIINLFASPGTCSGNFISASIDVFNATRFHISTHIQKETKDSLNHTGHLLSGGGLLP